MSFAQEIIKLPYKESLKESYPVNSYYSPTSEVDLIDNISEPELEVFLAEKPNGKAMIICPGGAMFFHAIEHEGREVAKKLNQSGISCFVLKYRLYPVDGNAQKYLDSLVATESWGPITEKAKEILPYATQDALESIKHLRMNADTYQINPDEIGIMGFSAGGAVTLEVAFKADEASRPNFIAPIYGWSEIVELQPTPAFKMPAFFDCASDDELFLADQTVALYKQWKDDGQLAELHMHESGGHGYGMKKVESIDSWSDLLVAWILRR